MTVDEVREGILRTLREDMNMPVDGDGSQPLGPGGVDLESLAIAELALHIEERYGVAFADEELEQVAGMTLDDLCVEIVRLADGEVTTGG